MGEVFEFIFEIILDIFGECIEETVSSRYVPKWLRILVLTLVIGLILFIIILVCNSNVVGISIFSLLALALWGFFVYKILKSKTSKYEIISLNEHTSFVAKRNLLGELKGELVLDKLSNFMPADKKIQIRFSKSEEFEKKRVLTLGDRENKFLTWLYDLTDDDFSYIVNHARTEWMEKHSNFTQIDNGRGLHLSQITYYEDELRDTEGIQIIYTFRDTDTNHPVRYDERRIF